MRHGKGSNFRIWGGGATPALKKASSTTSEGYYLVGPQATGWGFFNEWLRLEEDPNDANTYYISIPARYPISNIVYDSYKKGDDTKKLLSTLQGFFTESGFSFLIAKASTINNVDQKSGAVSTDNVKELLAPASCSGGNHNQWLGTKTTLQGNLSSYSGEYTLNGSFTPTNGMWEVRYPCNIADGNIVYDKTEYPLWDIFKKYPTKYYHLDPSYKALDGSYVFKINPSANTWSVTYEDKRVSYLTIIPSQNNDRSFLATKTYLFTQSKSTEKGYEDKYTNIYTNSDVQFEQGSKYLFLSNYKESYDSHKQIIDAQGLLGGITFGLNLDKAMLAATDVFANTLMQYGPSSKGGLDNYEGYRHALTQNSGSGMADISFKGSYSVKWYPYLGGTNNQGIVKFGDSNGNSIDIPSFNAISINPGSGNSALTKSYDLTYDSKYNAYTVTLDQSQFGNGSFYFKAAYDDQTWSSLTNIIQNIFHDLGIIKDQSYSEDNMVNTNPTSGNENENVLDANTSTGKHTDNTYYNAYKSGETGKYLIKLNLESLGSGSHISYTIDKLDEKKTISIPKVLSENIRTYSDYYSYNKPEGCKVYVVTKFTVGEGNKATVTLHKLNYIPRKTGVILIGDGEFGDPQKDVTTTMLQDGDSYTPYSGLNYLKAALIPTQLNASVVENDDVLGKKITYRNFFLQQFSNSSLYDHTTDYIGFFRTKNGSTLSKGNKAYLQIPAVMIDQNIQLCDQKGISYDTDVEAKGIQFVFDDDETTGIKETTTGNERIYDSAYYTLTGVKVANPTHGVYIHNGKKIVME